MKRHEWYTNRDTEERDYPDEELDPRDETENEWLDAPDIFRLSYGFHNGPECKNCGASFCHHCTPNRYNEECPA